MTTNPCQLTVRSSFVTTDSSRRFKFPMLITWVTTASSSGRDDNVVIKISHGIVVKMTTKIFTAGQGSAAQRGAICHTRAAAARYSTLGRECTAVPCFSYRGNQPGDCFHCEWRCGRCGAGFDRGYLTQSSPQVAGAGCRCGSWGSLYRHRQPRSLCFASPTLHI